MVNLRDRLFLLEFASAVLNPVTLHYVGRCCNDGTILRPEHVIYMLESVSGRSFQLQHIHRNKLVLAHPHSLTSHS